MTVVDTFKAICQSGLQTDIVATGSQTASRLLAIIWHCPLTQQQNTFDFIYAVLAMFYILYVSVLLYCFMYRCVWRYIDVWLVFIVYIVYKINIKSVMKSQVTQLMLTWRPRKWPTTLTLLAKLTTALLFAFLRRGFKMLPSTFTHYFNRNNNIPLFYLLINWHHYCSFIHCSLSFFTLHVFSSSSYFYYIFKSTIFLNYHVSLSSFFLNIF